MMLFVGGCVVLGGLYLAPLWLKLPLFRILFRPLLRKFLLSSTPPSPEERDRSFAERVLPHGPLMQLASNLWVVQGTLPQPGPKFSRNMVIYRIPRSQDLVLHSVVCTNSLVTSEIKALGNVRYIIVPSSAHTLDAVAYQKEFPDATMLGPKAGLESLTSTKGIRIDECVEDVFEGGSLGIDCVAAVRPVDGLDEMQFFMRLQAEDKVAFVCTDLLFNLDSATADPVSKFIGSANGFGMTTIGKIMCEDLGGFCSWLESQLVSRADSIHAIVVGHGAPIVGDDAVHAALHKALGELVQVT